MKVKELRNLLKTEWDNLTVVLNSDNSEGCVEAKYIIFEPNPDVDLDDLGEEPAVVIYDKYSKGLVDFFKDNEV